MCFEDKYSTLQLEVAHYHNQQWRQKVDQQTKTINKTE